jgi:hypothetical protein
LSDHGYTEERIEAPEGAKLIQGPTPPIGWDGPTVDLWQPNAADLRRSQVKAYGYGDIAIMGLNDIHRLRDQCGTLSFFVRGPVAREASTVFDDNLNVSFQPSGFGPTYRANLIQRLGETNTPADIQPSASFL